MVQLARCYVRVEGLSSTVQIAQGDIFKTDFSQATVLTLYLLTDLNLKLRPTILNLKPGTRVVSNTFKMGDWQPDRSIESEIGNTHAYLWIVPAQVEGLWEIRDELSGETFRVQLSQHYQELKSAPSPGEETRPIHNAKLRGANIEFTVDNAPPLQLNGVVEGDEMRLAALVNGASKPYAARRLR
jgi:hypothetical protein